MEHLAEIFLNLQAQGAHNINLVTPGQWQPWIIAALDIARAKGLRLPIVCNTGGYETVESVEAWRGYIDIWLADLKYVSSALSAELSAAPGLFCRGKARHRVHDGAGGASGVRCRRHPACWEYSAASGTAGSCGGQLCRADQMAAWNDADPGCFLPSVMSQYTLSTRPQSTASAAHHHLRIPPGGELRHGQGACAGLYAAKEQRLGGIHPSFDLTGV